MNQAVKLAVAMLFVAALAACDAMVTAAPGAREVRITDDPATVVGCRAVGKIDGTKTGDLRIMLGNAVIGDGGHTLLTTTPRGSLGIAYRCAED